MMWKDFFYFSRRERQGILVLIVLIAGIFLGKFLFTPKNQPVSDNQEIEQEAATETFVPNRSLSERLNDSSPDIKKHPDRKFNTHPEQSRQPEKRTYYQSRETKKNPEVRQREYPQTEKFAAGTIIELNVSDTAQLMKIPGIGSSFAKRITAYRKILGGYYRIEQLQEVYGMYEELYTRIIPYLQVDTANIERLPVNSASLDRLKAHPYINFYQAKAIVETRKKRGKLENINELILLEEFTDLDRERILPYLAF